MCNFDESPEIFSESSMALGVRSTILMRIGVPAKPGLAVEVELLPGGGFYERGNGRNCWGEL